jgi:hypothetical protein
MAASTRLENSCVSEKGGVTALHLCGGFAGGQWSPGNFGVAKYHVLSGTGSAGAEQRLLTPQEIPRCFVAKVHHQSLLAKEISENVRLMAR